MVHPLDALLRDAVGPIARERGYRRKGRNYYRYNDNGDAAHVNVQLLSGSTDFRINAGLSCHLGRENHPCDHEFTSGRNLWSWTPESPEAARTWSDGTLWNISVPAIGDLVRAGWRELVDVLDSLLAPGALTAELCRPSHRYPGRFVRSEVDLAFSMLNDGGLPRATTQLLVRRIAEASPTLGRQLQIALASEKG